jgi:hypothetical protein
LKKVIIIIFISIFGLLLISSAVLYLLASNGPNMINDALTEEVNIILPKSEEFKVTSTAKGDNQIKLSRLNNDVFTYYLDNSNCFDPNARGNDKTLQLIRIKEDGTYSIFDSIPVWMHGNVLTDETRNLIYYTTYEEVLVEGVYYSSVKIYTYHIEGDVISLINTHTLADDQNIVEESNPRVGAHIDALGNLAIAFGNYHGVMFVHVYDASNDLWIKHEIIHYLDTYEGDSNLYPYVRLNGINQIRVVASRDTSKDEYGQSYPNPARDYTRYFQYNGTEWTHFILSDLRDESTPDNLLSATPGELYFDSDFNTHVIVNENHHFTYYIIDSESNVTIKELPKLTMETLITFIRIVQINNQLYYVVSGNGLHGFSISGYLEIYDYETNKLLYRNNSVCKTPYIFISNRNDSDYFDIMVISRDKDYETNSETVYIQLSLNS